MNITSVILKEKLRYIEISARKLHLSDVILGLKGLLHPTAKICHIYAFFLYYEEKLYILYIILTRLGISDPKIGLFFSLDVSCSCKERVNFIFPLQGYSPRTWLILTEFIPVFFLM